MSTLTKAIIFDMDGLLIDSEPLWQEAEVEAFNQVGVPLTREMAATTKGLRIDEVVEHWFLRYPWETVSQEAVADSVMDHLTTLIAERGTALPGAAEAVRTLSAEYPIALASSSMMRIIDSVLTKLEIKEYFQVIHSAEFEPFGKPHPGIFIKTAEELGIAPGSCVVFEDSINGMLAAKAARMHCIAVPGEEEKGDARLAIADQAIDSLTDFTSDLLP